MFINLGTILAKVHNHGYSQAVMWFYVGKPIKYNTYFIMKYGFIKEAANEDELPYKIFVRGVKVDFSLNNIRRVMRFKRETTGAERDYKIRQALDQWIDEVLADLCIPGATWKLSSGQPAVPIQLRRTELHPLAKVIAQELQNKGNLAFPSTIYKLCKDAGVPLREFRRTSKIPE
ncbi:hypothetical protein PIB30_092188 [Stylosanthes scabra]|uniref:Uncharacterized protein n=1 Tax=Stylosanthes scabra TaxID=79078 RepID=A0ABU6VVQ6_9FABA|nr:hypothetical protein [Stylosanthes scabra]